MGRVNVVGDAPFLTRPEPARQDRLAVVDPARDLATPGDRPRRGARN